MSRLALITLGCPKNEVDSDTMRRAAEGVGWIVVDELQEADAIVVNTCAFIQEATEQSVEVILDALEDTVVDEGERVQIPIIVAGCMVNRYADDLAGELPEVAAFIRVGDTDALLDVLETLRDQRGNTSEDLSFPMVSPPSYAYLKIADGCDRCCNYCTIPSIRGSYRSIPFDAIIERAREHLAAGTQELILIAQDTGLYGLDLPEPSSLLQLLEELLQLSGLKRLRLMYLQPEGLTDELLELMAADNPIVPYLEVPLQHASPEILRSMGRNPEDARRFERQIAKARTLMPNLSLRTTLIAGYPGETQEQFDELCTFVERIGFDYAGVFAYSPEEGTPAATLSTQLPAELRQKRAQQLRDLADHIGWQKAADRTGATTEVLIEGYDEDEEAAYGRTPQQTPDIDGVVYLSKGAEIPIGSYVTVQLTDSILYDLEGEILD